jgi:hypothetical protein
MIVYPFGISGCFRLRNESQFMETAILSHLPYLDEAVLVVQPSEDDTIERAERLAAEHEKIRVEFYPYIVDWIDTPGFYEKDPDLPGHLVHLSNWALSKCRYSWIAKTEGDVICLTAFGKIVERIHQEPDKQHYYGRVILNVAGEHCDQISLEHPRNAGWDVGVFPNQEKYKFTRKGKCENIFIGPARTCVGWSGLHMQRSKAPHTQRIRDTGPIVPFTKENTQEALRVFNQTMDYVGIDNPLGEDCLYEKDWINHYLQGETCLIPV